ncbi:MAG: reverse transcriptase-like protein [Desulfobacterales bacterium]|uniref:ribonuclease H n=1 Tax=Candidatus Desulfatibia profunda TaxID=2841695 RepID=A0A8J6TL25_9BACT|nr:reverse transcriptase-like protein [Candidatus Desulfatibia profunda]MBL7180509.1 reverse transcriptase-like protein [Desulfobacterales bacterium]
MTTDRFNWKRMRFKDNKVWLAEDQNGKPVVKNGKVLIKYQLNQDYEYWVLQQYVQPIESSKSVTKDPAKKKPARKSPNTNIEQDSKTFDESVYGGAVCIYTDGASSGNPGPSGIGVVLRYGNHQKEISRHIGIATNNIAELEAIRTGLLEVKNTDLPVRVFTDSNYAYGVLVRGWKAKKNIEMVRSIKKTTSKFKDLQIIKVKGHAGIKGNERADLLATSAVKK